jgi:hypothetical protein
MKPINKIRSVVLLIAITAALPLLHGCATPNPNAGQPIVNPATGQPVTSTNAAGVVVTNVQPPFLPNAGVASAVGTIGALNTATAPLNPYSGLVSLGLGLTTLIAGGIAAWKNNQASGLNSQLTAVIQGVESATSTNGTTNPAPISAASVKQSIQSHATAAGVQPALAAKVLSVTGS